MWGNYYERVIFRVPSIDFANTKIRASPQTSYKVGPEIISGIEGKETCSLLETNKTTYFFRVPSNGLVNDTYLIIALMGPAADSEIEL